MKIEQKITGKALICFMLLLCIVPAYSQDWKEDLLKMNQAYLNAKSFQMDVEVKSYATLNDAKPLIDYKGKVASSIGNYYSSFMNRITLYNTRCVLVVDNNQKMILYKKSKGDIKRQSGFSIANLDSTLIVMGKNVKISYLQNTTAEKRMQLIYKNNALAKLELSINPVDNTIIQLIYYYDTKNPAFNNSAAKVIIDYSNVELNKAISDSHFSENKFIAIKKDKIIPLNIYSNYQLVNQDQTQTP